MHHYLQCIRHPSILPPPFLVLLLIKIPSPTYLKHTAVRHHNAINSSPPILPQACLHTLHSPPYNLPGRSNLNHYPRPYRSLTSHFTININHRTPFSCSYSQKAYFIPAHYRHPILSIPFPPTRIRRCGMPSCWPINLQIIVRLEATTEQINSH